MKRTNDHGAASRETGSPACRDEWRMADEMEAKHPSPEGSRWVPWRTVWIKDGIAPRGVDRETVDSYVESFFDLPPIEVQRDTFALIDGRHRLEAASRAMAGDSIRIREVDVSDEALALRAFEANLANGRAYTAAEKKEGLRLMVRSYPYLAAAELARRVGVSYNTASTYKQQFARVAMRVPGDARGGSQIDDRRSYGSTITPPVDRAPVSSFDPGEEPAAEYDDGEPDENSERAWLDAHRREHAPATADDAAPQAEASAGGDESRGASIPAAEVSIGTALGAEPIEGQNEPDPDADFGDFNDYSFIHEGVQIRASYTVLATNARTGEALREGLTGLIRWATKAVEQR